MFRHFSEVNNEATDEVWYKRAVEYHYNNPQSFVFSVPFDIGDKRPTQVTATHAIFKGKGSRKAPAAVVGVQIDYEKFRDTFMLVANKVGSAEQCILFMQSTVPIYVNCTLSPVQCTVYSVYKYVHACS